MASDARFCGRPGGGQVGRRRRLWASGQVRLRGRRGRLDPLRQPGVAELVRERALRVRERLPAGGAVAKGPQPQARDVLGVRGLPARRALALLLRAEAGEARRVEAVAAPEHEGPVRGRGVDAHRRAAARAVAEGRIAAGGARARASTWDASAASARSARASTP